MDHAEKNKRIAKNTVVLFLRMLFVLMISLYTSRVVLSSLGVKDYGIYNVAGSVVAFFAFLQSALTNASQRFFSYDLSIGNAASLRRTFSMSLNTHLIATGAIFILSETLGLWLLNSKLQFPEGRIWAANWVYQLSIMSFCVSVLKNPYWTAIISHENMTVIALLGIVESVLKLGAVFLLGVAKFDSLVLYSFLILLVSLVPCLGAWVYCRTVYPECRYHPVWSSELFKRMIQYSGWSIVVNAVDVAIAQSLVVFFNIFRGVTANAALGIANQVNVNLVQLLQSFTQSFNPAIIKSYAAGDREYFDRLLFSTSRLSFYLLYIVSLPVILNIDFMLKLWLGNVPDMAPGFIVLTLFYSLIDAYSAPLWVAVHATGNLKTHQILMSAIKIINIPLAYFALRYGLSVHIALAIKAGLNLVCSVVRPFYLRRLIGLPLREYFASVFVRVYGVAALSFPIPLLISRYMPIGWANFVVVSTCAVVISTLVVGRWGLTEEERTQVVGLLRNKVRGLGF